MVSVTSDGQEYSVDLEKRTCTCNVFQMDELPCPHALAHIKKFHLSAYSFCSEYFTKEKMLAAYAGTIFPMPSRSSWSIPADIQNIVVLPPDDSPKVGRPRKERYRSIWEKGGTTSSVKCGTCRKYGHNKRSCKGLK